MNKLLKKLFVFLFLVFVTEICFADVEYGLGVNFVVKNNKLIVYGVYCETPAHKYGLQSGDVILKYNEVVVSDIYNFFINNFITGELLSNNIKKEEEIVERRDYILKNIKLGDTINLEILRNGNKILKSIKIEEMPKKLPFHRENNMKKCPVKVGGHGYVYGQEFLLWSWNSKSKKWFSEIPTLNDSCVYKIDKYYKNEFEDLGIKTIIGETIEYSPISHTVVAVKAYCENFTDRSKASLVTEKVANEVSDKLNLLPKIVEIKEGFGNKYVFQFPTLTYDEPVIIQPVWENNTGSVEITCTSNKMQELLKKELAQVEKYTDFNKKERNVPTQLGGYKLGDVPIAKTVKDREKGIFEANGEFKFNSDGYTFLRHDNFLYFMNFGESGGAIGYTPKSHRIHEISMCYNKFSLETVSSKISNYIKNLLENDVKEIENRLGIKAVREAEDKYVFNFPSKRKTKLIVDVFKTLNQDAATYALMTGQREDMYGNKLSLAYGFIQLTLTSDEMASINNKEKAELLAIQKEKEDKVKEKKKQQDSAFGLN